MNRGRRLGLHSGRDSANPSQAPQSLHTNLLPNSIIIHLHHDITAGTEGGAGATQVHVHPVAAWRIGTIEVVNDRLIIHHVHTARQPHRTNADTADRPRPQTTRNAHTNVEGAPVRSPVFPGKTLPETAAPGRPGLRYKTTLWPPAVRPLTTTPPPMVAADRPR